MKNTASALRSSIVLALICALIFCAHGQAAPRKMPGLYVQVRVLHTLREGGDVNERYHDGTTALQQCAWNGLATEAKAMITAGARLNDVDGNGDTALHHAAREGHGKIVRSLLEAGGETRLRNAAGELPVDAAKKAGHTAIVELLEAHRGLHRASGRLKSTGPVSALLTHAMVVGGYLESKVPLAGKQIEGADEQWPFSLHIETYDERTTWFSGRILWKTLGATHGVEGSWSPERLVFRELRYIKRGDAVLGTMYQFIPDGHQATITGTWTLNEAHGTATLDCSAINELRRALNPTGNAVSSPKR